MIASREYVKDIIVKTLNSIGFKRKNNKYFNNETIIGEWINGKPIYRNIVSCNNISSEGSIYCPSNINNIERIINITLLITGDNFSVAMGSSGGAYNTTTGRFAIDGITYFKNTAATNPNNFRISIASNGISDLKNREINIIFDYIKYSD